MAVEITSSEELRAWLESRPLEWSQVVAFRVALRTLVLVLDPTHVHDSNIHSDCVLLAFRTLAVSMAIDIGSAGVTLYQYVASDVADAINDAVAKVGCSKFEPGSTAFFLALHATTRAADAAQDVPFAGSDGRNNSQDAAMGAQEAIRAIRETGSSAAGFWHLISQDCEALASGFSPQKLKISMLWDDPPDWWINGWVSARKWLSLPDGGFGIWCEWYYGRVKGLPHAFANFDDAADEAFYRWIVKQEAEWWSREPAEVNAEISEFVNDLRQPDTIGPSFLTPAELEQNQRAISFTAESNGQVGLATDRDEESVDHSHAAQERHAEAREEARNALEACRPNVTQATDIEGPLERYLDALGGDTHGISPALLIARGEKLRRLIGTRKDEFGSAIPFSEAQAGCLEDWLTAHNLLVGLDPYLSDIERKARGPDAVPTVLDLDALRAVIQSAQAADIPNAEASQALTDIAENVPANAAPTDRRLIQATEAMKNFIRGVGAVVKKHGWNAIKATGGAAYFAALWVQRHIEWLREVFANEPSILSVLEKIAALPL